MKCLGATDASTTENAAVPDLKEWIRRRKGTVCPAYQQAADALCNFKEHGTAARYDHHLERWMCIQLEDMAFDSHSYCADNCGGPKPCVGGIPSGEIPKYTVYIVQHPDMAAAFEAVQPCEDAGDICVATDINPPQCLRH
ncbi:microneme protein, partial [Cystoisospora suis]